MVRVLHNTATAVRSLSLYSCSLPIYCIFVTPHVLSTICDPRKLLMTMCAPILFSAVGLHGRENEVFDTVVISGFTEII